MSEVPPPIPPTNAAPLPPPPLQGGRRFRSRRPPSYADPAAFQAAAGYQAGPGYQTGPGAYPRAPGRYRRRSRAARRVFALIWLALIAAVVVPLLPTILGAARSAAPKYIPGNGSAAHPAAADVTVTTCTVSAAHYPSAEGTILNHSSGRSVYSLTITFEDSLGGQVGKKTYNSPTVAPGATTAWSLFGVQPVSGPVTCHISRISRLAAH